MGPGIIIPVVVLAIVIPVGIAWAKRLKDGATGSDDAAIIAPASKLTSNALRRLPSPAWRVVYEIGETKLAGVEHVMIGPPGVFAVQTSMEPLPPAPAEEPSAQAIALGAIARGGLDDALARCGMSSDRLVKVHWGPPIEGRTQVDVLPGVTAVDGRALDAWAASLPATLGAAQIDLAWQTVTTAIGRPDPLA